LQLMVSVPNKNANTSQITICMMLDLEIKVVNVSVLQATVTYEHSM